jgi:hypothetical protein
MLYQKMTGVDELGGDRQALTDFRASNAVLHPSVTGAYHQLK